MKVLVCGSRDWKDRMAIMRRFKELPANTEIIEGGAAGADSIAKEMAINYAFDVVEYRANWNRDGKAAGPIRNRKMLDREKPDLVIAFQLNESRGTQHIINEARKRGIEVEIHTPSPYG